MAFWVWQYLDLVSLVSSWDFEVGGGHGAVLGVLRLVVLMPVG